MFIYKLINQFNPTLYLLSILFTCFITIPKITHSHISLTFPLARKYNLDYLDNGSLPPCGMPKGSIKTSFISGSTINITWHLGYPHQGTHRLELLSSNGTELFTLASQHDSNDPTAQRHEVKLPEKFICQDCIIRLLRQSAELGNPYYSFWSCSDVDIVEQNDYVETCSGNGRYRDDGVCGCKPGFWGKRCQYEDECRKDDDCGKQQQGKCIDLGGTNLPRRQCFCHHGFIGKKCSKTNKIGNVTLPTFITLTEEYLNKNYLNQKLDKRFHLYWRLIEGENLQMEFVLKVNGTSYAALGWRPLDFDGDCTRYPLYEENNVNSKSQKSRLTREIQDDPPPIISSINLEKENIQNHSRNNNDDEKEKNYPRYQRLHPMSCADVMIGAAQGNLSRILDYWSGDISTPREDTLWDGIDNIEAGGGWETLDRITIIIFRKKINSEDIHDVFNDWPLDVPSLVIWARGQEHGEYIHRLPSGVDPGQPASVPNYYTKDEIKYHGHRGQRGTFSIDFLADGAREFFLSKNLNTNT